jgi:MoaA/NifB/PqqE/SkfB family radical SAM enzyme
MAASGSALATAFMVRLGEAVNRTFVLPLAVLYPTSRCNSRCVSCDWWKSSGEDDLTLGEIDAVAGQLARLGTRVVLFSGGEPLLRADVFDAAAGFRKRGIALHLLTSGVLLDRFAANVAAHFSRLVVSLDASNEELYRAVRGIAALETLTKGVARMRAVAPGLPVTARATLHRANFRELPRLVRFAREIGLDGISFLAADVSSAAFGRRGPNEAAALALSPDEIAEFATIVDEVVAREPEAFASGFVAESPEKLRRLPRYYAALAGLAPFPPVECNAPWMSIVIEANGAVRPCFFHESVGNVRRATLDSIVAGNLRAFRGALDMATDGTCRRCVCSIRTGWKGAPWH